MADAAPPSLSMNALTNATRPARMNATRSPSREAKRAGPGSQPFPLRRRPRDNGSRTRRTRAERPLSRRYRRRAQRRYRAGSDAWMNRQGSIQRSIQGPGNRKNVSAVNRPHRCGYGPGERTYRLMPPREAACTPPYGPESPGRTIARPKSRSAPHGTPGRRTNRKRFPAPGRTPQSRRYAGQRRHPPRTPATGSPARDLRHRTRPARRRKLHHRLHPHPRRPRPRPTVGSQGRTDLKNS